MKVHARTPSRAGLAGNPSDGYGGRAVAVAINSFTADATIEPALGVRISSPRTDPVVFDSPRALLERSPSSLDGRHRLAIACCHHFFETALEAGRLEDIPSAADGFDLGYTSDIPFRMGLAGSSALTISFLRALALRYAISIPEAELPGMALAVETDQLGIHGGLMDRVAQVLRGVTYMDLSRTLIRDTGHGAYEALPEERLPGLFLAWRPDLASGSETVHNKLRDRVNGGDRTAIELLRELAGLADEARQILLCGAGSDLAAVMDANFNLRARLIDVGAGNRLLVKTGRLFGAGVKQAGSGGAVVGAHDGDPERLARLRIAYDQIGARFVVPTFESARTAGSTPSSAAPPAPPVPESAEPR